MKAVASLTKESNTMIRLPKWLLVILALALFMGLAVPVLADEAKGKIKSITPDKKEFVLTDKNGKDWECTCTEDAKVRLNDKDSRLNELKEGDEVTIVYDKKDGKVMVSEIRCKRE